MMLTKPKPDNENEAAIKEEIVEEPCADDLEKDLERRLAMLGTGTNDDLEVVANEQTETKKNEKEEDNLISFDPLDVPTPTAAHNVETQPEPPLAAQKPSKSALLVSYKTLWWNIFRIIQMHTDVNINSEY